MTTPGSGHPVSWDEHDAMPEDTRVEHVDGHLLVGPSPTRTHQRIAAGLPRYWVVDPRERTPTTHVLDDGAFRATHVLRPGDGTVELDLGVALAPLDVAALLGP
ncbi:hypothetical protein [Kineococcus gypseus]|uniref:hypothetical protein n=1 Tax=Kineococcus gypseus TaxID=1637102 RepID=UPI003D7D7638